MKTQRLAPALVMTALAFSPLSADGGGGGPVNITDASQFGGGTSVIDFSQFALGGAWNWTGGAQIGGLVGEDVYASAFNMWGEFAIGDGYYGLNGVTEDNGGWEDKTSIGLDAADGYIEFAFNDGPVAGVGAFFNYAPGWGAGDPFIEALDASGNVLASMVLDIDTDVSSVNEGGFFGFHLGTASIARFRMYNAYVIADDLTFTRLGSSAGPGGGPSEVVPEPVTMVLLGSGLLGVGGAARRRRRLLES